MTDNTCTGNWGSGAIGFVLGAALTGNGGLFGNNCGRNNCGNGCGYEDCKISAIDAKVSDLESWNQSREILGTVTAQSDEILDTLNQINRDNYAVNIQQLINAQSEQRQIDNQFCKTREFIAADGTATRAAINGFETRYLEDRVRDRDLTIAKLQNELTAAPLACGLAAVNAKLDSVIGCAGVRTCGNSCGSSCGTSCGFPTYAVPPVGTFEFSKSYNPNVPTATA